MNFKGVEICCPHCRGDLQQTGREATELRCLSCGASYPVILGIPDLRVFPDPYIDIEADRAKGEKLAAHLDDMSFEQFVEFYYRITAVVPARDARRYARGLMAARARADSALATWEKVASSNGQAASASLLEIGCGTAPLLVAAAPRFARVVGIDIAFRWLVVAKKRLMDAGLDSPLLCACAEALPLSDESIDRVVADSVLEHVRDQAGVLAESRRVLRAGGRLFVATPNRYSLGPDPQVGIWAGGFLPNRLIASYVRRQGGIPPKRQLLSYRSLSSLIQESGFDNLEVFLPDIPTGQRDHFGKGMKVLIDIYQAAKGRPVSRAILERIGPLLYAVAEKTGPRAASRSLG